MIKVNKITFENFFSFKEYQEFYFDDHGINLISGSNLDNKGVQNSTEENETDTINSGKTSFTFPIEYAFKGTIPKKLKKKDDVVNKKTGENLSVYIEFELKDSMYAILRTRKHIEHGNALFLFEKQNGKYVDLSYSDPSATQRAIDELIFLSNDTFRKTVLFSRDNVKNFLEQNVSDRTAIIENIVKLSEIDKYYKKATTKFSEKNKQLSEANNEVIILETKLTTNKQYYQKNVKEREQKIENNKKEIENLKINLSYLQQEKVEIDNYINLINKYEQVITEKQKIDQEYDILKREKIDLVNQKNDIENKIQIKKELLNNTTPTYCHNCGAIQDEKYFNSKVNEITEEINNLEQKYNFLLTEENNLTIQINEIVDNSFVDKQIEDIKIELKNINMTNEEKKELYQNYKTNKINNTQERINQIENKINYLIEENKVLLEYDDTELKKEIENIETNLQFTKKTKVKLEKEVEMLEYWKKILNVRESDSIKQKILEYVIPTFNEILSELTNYFFFDNLVLIFDNMLNETIIYRNTDYNYHSLSTGEKAKLNFCINFALFEITRLHIDTLNIIFFDEIFANLDMKTIELGISLIENKYASDNAIYIISNDPRVISSISPNNKYLVEMLDEESVIKKI